MRTLKQERFELSVACVNAISPKRLVEHRFGGGMRTEPLHFLT